MTGRFTVVVAERAATQLEKARDWWSSNRPKAPGALENDVGRALDLLAAHPEVGARCASDRYSDLRRLHLRRIRYYLYYVISVKLAAVNVVAIGHSSMAPTAATCLGRPVSY